MQHAMEFERFNTPFLHVGARRRRHEAFLFHVRQGGLLIRLGQMEYLVEPQQAIWLPTDSLFALTVLPNTQYDTLTFSVRCAPHWPMQSGWQATPSVLSALCDHFAQQTDSDAQSRALSVLKDVAYQTQWQNLDGLFHLPANDLQTEHNNSVTALAQRLNIDAKHLQKALMMREAMRLEKSGQKAEKIAQRLSLSLKDFETLKRAFLG